MSEKTVSKKQIRCSKCTLPVDLCICDDLKKERLREELREKINC
jgi:DTW domain-containing protein YfiP